MNRTYIYNSMSKTIYYSSYPIVNKMLLYKEHGEIPYYFSKIFGYTGIIDDYNDINDASSNFRGVHLLPTPKRFRRMKQYLNIFLHAKEIDILFVILIHPDTMLKMLSYRLGGGKGKIYLKLDLGLYEKNDKDLLVWENMNFFLKIAHCVFKQFPDIYTVETQKGYERLSSSYYGDLINKKKLFRLPNGFDPEILSELGIARRSVSQKEKIILTTGRIGLYQKNTELLLEILAEVDLKDWEMYIVGPIENGFQKTIDRFYEQYPEKNDSVHFMGLISQAEKFDLYDRARVFILTSRYEGFAFALVEAAYMKNYIISTDVGGARDVSEFTPSLVISNPIIEPFVSKIRGLIGMSESELNTLIPDTSLSELTWEYLFKDNDGISLLVQENGQVSS